MGNLFNFKTLLQKLSSSIPKLDPEVFKDPIAMQTSWKPLKSGGSNFQTRKLIVVRPKRIEFVPAIGMKLFSAIFMGIGMVMIVLLFTINSSRTMGEGSWVVGAVGFVFFVAGSLMLYFSGLPVVFDKGLGFFWRGKKAPNQVYRIREIKKVCKLEEIHALQIIEEYISGNKSSYFSYELNIILRDSSRLNVTDHGNYPNLLEDAIVLSEFLNVPLWDAYRAVKTSNQAGLYTPGISESIDQLDETTSN